MLIIHPQKHSNTREEDFTRQKRTSSLEITCRVKFNLSYLYYTTQTKEQNCRSGQSLIIFFGLLICLDVIILRVLYFEYFPSPFQAKCAYIKLKRAPMSTVTMQGCRIKT